MTYPIATKRAIIVACLVTIAVLASATIPVAIPALKEVNSHAFILGASTQGGLNFPLPDDLPNQPGMLYVISWADATYGTVSACAGGMAGMKVSHPVNISQAPVFDISKGCTEVGFVNSTGYFAVSSP
jgi:hypothetical protein